MRNAAGPTVSGANHKPELPSTPFPCLMHARFPGNVALCEGIATFSLSMMQTLDYDLRVLCTVGLLAHQPLKSAVALPLSIPHRTRGRGHQRIQEGWLGTPYGPTQRPAMTRLQGRGRSGHIPWATTGSPDLGCSREPQRFPGAASSQGDGGAWP